MITILPFLKWAGGKRKLIPAIIDLLPKRFNRYLEPFLGGGAVALALNHDLMFLNDANIELINAYEVVRDDLDGLIAELDSHKANHSEFYYYKIREQDTDILNKIQRAARFIYLNKTAYNGLYRVNQFGKFNVPFGKYKNPTIYNRENLEAVSTTLKRTHLYSLDYVTFLKMTAKEGDLIYLDPPYHPVGQYSDFKRYTPNQFRENDQLFLATVYDELIRLGAYPILSNSYSELTLNLYSKHNVHIVEAARNINHDGNGRSKIREIIVTP